MEKRSLLYAGVTILIWSTLATVAKLVLTKIPNMQLLFLSSLFAFLFMLCSTLLSRKRSLLRLYRPADYLRMAGLGFLGLFLYEALYYHGIDLMTSQEACILNYLWPVMIVVFSCIFLKERMTAVKIAALLCSFAGIVVLTLGSGLSGGSRYAEGVLSCIGAAVCYGMFSALNKKADYDQSITMTVIWLTVTVCSGIAGAFTEVWVPVSGSALPGLLWLGIGVNAVAYWLWANALNRAKNTALIANLAYLTPFLSLTLSAIVLGEQITVRAVIALVLIIGGILLQSLYPAKRGGEKV